MSSRDSAAAAAVARFATAWDGAFLGITLAYFAVQSWKNYFTLSSALRRLRAAPNPRVFDLRSLLNVDEYGADGPLVVIRGSVLPKSAFDRGGTATQLVSGSGEHAVIALLDEEKILPVGKEITAIGICMRRGGALEIKSCRCRDLPYFLSDMTKGEIEADMASKSSIHFWCGILLGTISVGILCYTIHRMWLRWQEQRERRRQAEELQRDNGDDETGNVADGEQCVVCLRRLYGAPLMLYREGGFSDVPFLLVEDDELMTTIRINAP